MRCHLWIEGSGENRRMIQQKAEHPLGHWSAKLAPKGAWEFNVSVKDVPKTACETHVVLTVLGACEYLRSAGVIR